MIDDLLITGGQKLRCATTTPFSELVSYEKTHFSYLQSPFPMSQTILPLYPVKFFKPCLQGHGWSWDLFSCLLPWLPHEWNSSQQPNSTCQHLTCCSSGKWTWYSNKLHKPGSRKSQDRSLPWFVSPCSYWELLWMSHSSCKGQGGIPGPQNHPQDFPSTELPTFGTQFPFVAEKQFLCLEDALWVSNLVKMHQLLNCLIILSRLWVRVPPWADFCLARVWTLELEPQG